jgi:hypothetical protein
MNVALASKRRLEHQTIGAASYFYCSLKGGVHLDRGSNKNCLAIHHDELSK